MIKKVTSSILAALMIAGSISFSAFAAMTNGTVVIGNKAFDLNYVNEPTNVLEITKEIIAGGNIYVKDFSGNWIDNVTGKQVNASTIPAVVYKTPTGVIGFDAGDKDQLSIKSVGSINVLAVTAGTLPILPATVSVTLSDGTTKSADVTWNLAAKTVATYAVAGTVTINGIIATYSNYAVSASVTVNAAQGGGVPGVPGGLPGGQPGGQPGGLPVQTVVKTALANAISIANAKKSSAKVSVDGTNILLSDYWVTAAVMTTYENAILAAQALQGNVSATQAQVDSAVVAMDTATVNFNITKGTKSALTLQEIAAEVAVAAFETAPITNIGQIDTATSLKAAAELKVIDVIDAATKAAFTNRITTKTIAMSIAEINIVSIPSSIATALTKYAQVLGLNFTDYNTLTNKIPVQTALLTPVFTNISQIKVAFDTAVGAQKAIETAPLAVTAAIAEINNATIDTIGAAITNNAIILGLDVTVYSGLNTFNSSVNTAMTGKSFSTTAAIKLAFDTAVKLAKEAKAISAINLATALTMDSQITNNANDLGLVLTDYNALINKGPVQTAMLAPVFVTVAEIKAAFDSAVATQKGLEAITVTLDKTSIIMFVTKNDKITATLSPIGATATWTSNNSGIATVDGSGNVVGVSIGATTIKATTIRGNSANCDVIVTTEAVAIDQVTQFPAINIVAYSNALGLNLAAYNLLSADNKSLVQGALLGQTFSTAILLKVAFDAAVSAATPVPPAPVTPAAPNVFANDTTNTVIGIDTLMEYKLDGAANYVAYDPISFNLLDLSGDHTLLVRYAASGIDPFGPNTILTFTTNPLIVPAAPLVTNNDALNTVSGMLPGMEFSFNGFDYYSYDSTTFGQWDLGGDFTLYVRIAATANNQASDATELIFNLP